MTEAQIAAELGRIEREMRASIATSQAATKEAMRLIEKMMADLEIPLAKVPA